MNLTAHDEKLAFANLSRPPALYSFLRGRSIRSLDSGEHMASIIAGTFENFIEAERFVEALLNANILKEDVTIIPIDSSELAYAKCHNSQAGCASSIDGRNETYPDRIRGSLVAVHAEENAQILSVALLLNRSGARSVEWAPGTWKNGHWVYFIEHTPTRLIGQIDDALIRLLS